MSYEYHGKPGRECFSGVALPGGGYAVRAPDGRLGDVIFTFGHQARAAAKELQAVADAKALRGPRACMCCQAEFISEGIHNRLCDGCRKQRDSLGDPHRPYIARRA
jgi:hypothetical protein